MSRQQVFLFLSAAVLLARVGPAFAQDLPGDVDAGRTLAEKTCSECHSASAAQRRLGLYDAPGFDEIAAKVQTTAISLRAFLQQPHPSMPNLILTQDERDDAIAYILSLKQQSY
jgi:mono/diheme cytochrome c family protein